MAVSTAGIAIKDDFPRDPGETAVYAVAGAYEDAEDEEYRGNMREIYEISNDLLSRKLITEKEYNEFMAKSRDRKLVRDVLDDVVMIFVNEEVHEAKREMQAEKERTEREQAETK